MLFLTVEELQILIAFYLSHLSACSYEWCSQLETICHSKLEWRL